MFDFRSHFRSTSQSDALRFLTNQSHAFNILIIQSDACTAERQHAVVLVIISLNLTICVQILNLHYLLDLGANKCGLI